MNRRMSLSALLVLSFFSAHSADSSTPKNSLETMLEGFSTCELQSVYIDWQTNLAMHPYLKKLVKKGVRIEDGFARLSKFDQQFHGIKVLELLVPAQTWTAHRLILDAPHTRARVILEKALRTRLPKSSPLAEDSEEVVPLLRPYPGKPNWSVLECVSTL